MLLLEMKRKKGTLNTIHFVGIGGIWDEWYSRNYE